MFRINCKRPRLLSGLVDDDSDKASIEAHDTDDVTINVTPVEKAIIDAECDVVRVHCILVLHIVQYKGRLMQSIQNTCKRDLLLQCE